MPITVTLMLSVPTPLVASPVPVTLDTVEMDSPVWVSSYSYQGFSGINGRICTGMQLLVSIIDGHNNYYGLPSLTQGCLLILYLIIKYA